MPCIKYTLHLFTLAALFTVSACKNQKNHADSPVIYSEKNPAYKTLNDSIDDFPANAALYLRRAIRLTQENKHEEAFADFQKAWTLQPLLENALPYAANLEILGRYRERLGLLESMKQQFPSHAQVGRLLAEAYNSYGKPGQAAIIYKEMLARDSLDPETYYEQAILLQQLKDTSGAISSLQKAYTLQRVDVYGLELAHLYAEQKNPRALDICNFILRQDSARLLIDPFFIKGIYYSNIRQFPKAIVQFDSCILRDWKTTDAYLEKGRAFFHLQKFNPAIQTFKMAITVTNTDPDAYFWLARCYEALHQNTDAIINYQKALSLDRSFSEARDRMDSLDRGFAHPSQ